MPRFEWSTIIPKQTRDVICLVMPWGTVRHFPVPARNPNNPTYQLRPWIPRDVTRNELIDVRLGMLRYGQVEVGQLSGLKPTTSIPDDIEG